MALVCERNLVAPLALQPLGALSATTATPDSAQRRCREGRNRRGSFSRLNLRISDKERLKTSASHSLQSIALASTSPCRNHAATAAGFERNAGEVLKDITCCKSA